MGSKVVDWGLEEEAAGSRRGAEYEDRDEVDDDDDDEDERRPVKVSQNDMMI